MKKGYIKYGIILIVLIFITLFIQKKLLTQSQRNKEVITLVDELSDIMEIDVFYMVDGVYEHQHLDEKEIQQLVEFFQDRKYTVGKKTDKDGYIATILLKSSAGLELSITIQSTNLLAIESSKDSKTVMYESEHIGEEWRKFYSDILMNK